MVNLHTSLYGDGQEMIKRMKTIIFLMKKAEIDLAELTIGTRKKCASFGLGEAKKRKCIGKLLKSVLSFKKGKS
jgi:hypothetical protein